MAKEKSLVEEAILSMKNLEEAVAENAKGILASTMKEEIKELVKESLSEQEEDEIETDVDMEMPDSDEESDDEGMEMDTDNIDDEPIDLTNKSDEEVLRVFQLMGPDDHIVVTKDDSGNINVKDNETNKEYMIVGESDEDLVGDAGMPMDEDDTYGMMEMDFEQSPEMQMDEEEFEDSNDMGMGHSSEVESIVKNLFDESYEEEEDMTFGDFDDSENEEDEFSFDDSDFEEEEDEGVVYEIEMGEEAEEEEEEGVVYEIEMDEEDDTDEDFVAADSSMEESYLEEAMKKIKAKGTGNPSKFKYPSKDVNEKGFKTKMKQGPKSVGTGKPKFAYDKSGENLDGEFKIKPKGVKKGETTEASRTLGNGRDFRKGGLPKRRAHSNANINIKENLEAQELQILREKNEEYRKALNVFRNKLNEVAVFNSNLAYATRLFTEHSTSKQEKINILRRFDGVESLKESKNLYKIIKDELSGNNSQPMNESFEKKIEKAPSSGSAINLIESKTYENPQFLRMKDLMTKLK